MKEKKLLDAIGGISDRHIEQCAPGGGKSERRKGTGGRGFLKYAAVAACVAVLTLAGTVFAVNYVQGNMSIFYMRYLSPEEMAVADSIAEQYGAEIYFEGLMSEDYNKIYFSINKLAEYYNDLEVREKAIAAITPFYSEEALNDPNADPGEIAVADAASFALSVLKGEFTDPRMLHMSDGSVVFTLFNNYSDYGSYNKIWRFKDGELSVLAAFDRPMMYITSLIPSPDGRLFAASFASNKSGYLLIWDLENGRVSPELIDSARVAAAGDSGIVYWQRIDFENYSGTQSEPRWVSDGELEFTASFSYPGTGDDDGEFIREITVNYDFRQKTLEYEIEE